MNSASFDKVLRRVLLVPVLTVLCAAAILYWSLHQANLTVAQIQATDQRIGQTSLIEKLLIDQETALRGYQVTRNPDFLVPFLQAERDIPPAFALRRSISTTPRGLEDLRHLQARYADWHDTIALPIIAHVRAGQQAGDDQLNLQGKQKMDAMRVEIAAIYARMGEHREASVAHWREQTRSTTLALALVALLLGPLIGLYTRRHMQDVSAAFRRSHEILRARAEEAFRSEQNLRTTLQSIADGVITCDAEGRILLLNDAAVQLTGWSAGDARSRPLEDVFRILHESTREPLENPVARARHLNRTVSLPGNTILIRRDASELFIADSAAPMRDRQGQIIGFVLVFRDVTLARKSQEALLANEKLAVAGRLSATIAHEIHNPLDSIANLLYLLDGNPDPEQSRHFLTLARQETARVAQISRAMLSLYRESRAPIPIDLRELIESVLLLTSRRFTDNSATVDAHLPAGLAIHGFPAELRQVFTNLVTNAAEVTPPGGAVTVTGASTPPSFSGGRHQPPGVLIAIHDTGPGIPADVRPRLFSPFFTTKGERGTGLGLWVSHGIVTKHGGSIHVESSTDPATHGTTVSVFLPVDPLISQPSDLQSELASA